MDLAGPLPFDEDALHLVLNELRHDSPNSLYATCLVSRLFNSLSTPHLYRSIPVGDDKTGVRRDEAGQPHMIVDDVEIVGTTSEEKASWDGWPSDALLACTPGRLEKMKKYTREVVVKGHVSRLQLVELLMSMQRLEHLKWAWWAETLPAVVFNRLGEHWPNASLSVVDFPLAAVDPFPDRRPPQFAQSAPSPSPTQVTFRPKMPRPVSSFDVLRMCLNLRSFKATINTDLGRGLVYLMNVIATCPNLKEFHITHRKIGTNVCSSTSSFSLLRNTENPLPPVVELVTERLTFTTLRSSFGDTSQLRRLRLINVSMRVFLRAIRGRSMPRLEEFRLEERCIWEPEALQKFWVTFLFELPSLHVLSLLGVVGRIPMTVITMHGQSLRSLQLLEAQHWMQTRSTQYTPGINTSCPMLRLEDIRLLNALCPHLERLTLDIGRGADWPWPRLEAIVQHEHLRFLTLYTSINTVSSKKAIGSQILKINKASAEQLFLQLRAMKQGKPLEELQVNLGEWNHIRYSLIEHLHPLDYRCGDLFTCSMDYRSGKVIVKSAWAELRAHFTRRDLWCNDRFIEPLDAKFLPNFGAR